MSDIRLNDLTWDIELENGDIVLTETSEAVRQHLRQRLQTFLNEWFLDARVGVPFYEHVLIKNPEPLVLDSIFKSVILNTPGVEKLLEFDIDVEKATRKMTLLFKVQASDQVLDFTQVLGEF